MSPRIYVSDLFTHHPWLLTWNKRDVSRKDTGPNMWPWAMTSVFDFQGQVLIRPYPRNGVVDWHGTKQMWVDRKSYPLCDFELWLHPWTSLHWRHNDHDGVSYHQPHGCLLNRLFGHRSKKTSKLRVTGLCAGISPGPVNSPHKGPVLRTPISAKYCWFGWWLGAWSTPSHHPTQLRDIYNFR